MKKENKRKTVLSTQEAKLFCALMENPKKIKSIRRALKHNQQLFSVQK